MHAAVAKKCRFLHLLSTATQAIDKAPALSVVPADTDGHPRPLGAGADIGAENLPPRAEEIPSLPLHPLASPSPPSKWSGRRDTSLCHAPLRTGRASHLALGLKPLASRSRWTSGSRRENSSGV